MLPNRFFIELFCLEKIVNVIVNIIQNFQKSTFENVSKIHSNVFDLKLAFLRFFLQFLLFLIVEQSCPV